MSINALIEKTFCNPEVNTLSKKTNSEFTNINLKPNENDNIFYSRFLKKKKVNDDKSKGNQHNIKGIRKEKSTSNVLFIPGQKQDHSQSPQTNQSIKTFDESGLHCNDRASKTSYLNPRKIKNLKTNTKMILLASGINQNKKEAQHNYAHNRKSINVPRIDFNELISKDNKESPNVNVNKNIVPETKRTNPNVLKILIPQYDKLKELEEEMKEEEEKRQLVIQTNIIQIEFVGKRKSRFLYDSLKIQKLNSIKELQMKQPEDINQSIVIYNQLDRQSLDFDKIPNKNEKNIIIINQNEFNNYNSNERTKKAKNTMICCIPLK